MRSTPSSLSIITLIVITLVAITVNANWGGESGFDRHEVVDAEGVTDYISDSLRPAADMPLFESDAIEDETDPVLNNSIGVEMYNSATSHPSATDLTWTNLGPHSEAGVMRNLYLDQARNLLFASSPDGGLWVCYLDYPLAGWRPISDFLPNIEITAFGVHPINSNIIYVANKNKSLYRTDDGGDTWTRLPSFRSSYGQINKIVVSPTDELFVGAITGLYKSTDNGSTLSTPLKAGDILDAAIDPADARILYVGIRNDGIWKTSDGGMTWHKKQNLHDIDGTPEPSPDPNCPGRNGKGQEITISLGLLGIDNDRHTEFQTSTNRTVAVMCDTHIFVSTNGGESFDPKTDVGGTGGNWQRPDTLRDNEWCNALAVDPWDSKRMFVGRQGSDISITTDGGSTWAKNNKTTHEDIHDIVFKFNPLSTDRSIFVANDGGVDRSLLSQNPSFSTFNNSLTTSQLFRAGISGSAVAANSDHNGIIGTTDIDSSARWKGVVTRDCGYGNNGMEGSNVYKDPKRPERFYFLFHDQIGRFNYPFSGNASDCANNASRFSYFPPYNQPDNPRPRYRSQKPIAVDTRAGSQLIIAEADLVNRQICGSGCPGTNQAACPTSGNYHLMLTRDGDRVPTGAYCSDDERTPTWEMTAESADDAFVSVSFAPPVENTVYAITRKGTLYTANIPLPAPTVIHWDRKKGPKFSNSDGLGIRDFAPLGQNRLVAITKNLLLQTSNGGANWTMSLVPWDEAYSIASDGSYIYVGADDGIYRKLPTSNSWTKVNGDSLPNVKVSQVLFDRGYVYAVTYGRGLWRTLLTNNVKAERVNTNTSPNMRMVFTDFLANASTTTPKDLLGPEHNEEDVFHAPVGTLKPPPTPPFAVDTDGDVGKYASEAVVNGRPAISYYDGTNGTLKLITAKDAGGTRWNVPKTLTRSSCDVGQYTSLADVDSEPDVSYFDATNGGLNYAKGDASISIDRHGDAGSHTSLAVINGYPAISYYNDTNGTLQYVRARDKDGIVWGSPVQVDSGGVGSENSLAMIDGKPAISYFDFAHGELKFVRAADASGDTWNLPMTVDSNANVGKFTSLAEVRGRPAISYYDSSNSNLKYVRANDPGGRWNTPITISNNGDVGQYTSFVVFNTRPAISYYDRTNGDLVFVRAGDELGNHWDPPIIVDSGGSDNIGLFTSMVSMTVAGQPFAGIAYYDQTNGDLKWSSMLVPSPTPPTLGSYPTKSMTLGADTTITPNTPPTNTPRINVSTATNFKGKLEGDPVTGIVRVTNAHPAGTYSVKVESVGGTRSTFRTFMLTVTTSARCNPVAFANPANFGVANSPTSISAGDFNGDGKQDLAVVRSGSNKVSISLGDGTGGFGAPTNFDTGIYPQSVALGDFDDDGKQDLAVANWSSNNVSILLGTGAGSFIGPFNYAAGSNPQSVAVGDFNDDAKQDLAVANLSSNNVSILIGNGLGSFSDAVNFEAGTLPVSVTVGDFNGDNKQDIAVANTNFAGEPGTVSILLGVGSGSFAGATNFATGSSPISITVGDFNGDRKQDLAVANSTSDNVSILLGNGMGSFAAAENFAASSSPVSVAVGDFNRDRKQDLAVTNSTSDNVSILIGNGFGSFAAATNFGVGTRPASGTVGDFNGDGKQDLAVTNRVSNNVSVLLSDCGMTASNGQIELFAPAQNWTDVMEMSGHPIRR